MVDDKDQKEWTNKRVDKFVVVNNKIGEGAFGKVFSGFFQEDEKKQIAAKAISIKEISNSHKMLELIKREISILQKVKSRYIVRLYDVARTNHNLYLFFEYCEDGDLKKYLSKKEGGYLSEQEALLFFKHIVEGFKALFANNIIHRDIKPANILLHEGCAKISDFGFARSIETGMNTPNYLSRFGSPLYMAPQILEGTEFCSKCDVWSVGVVFYEMLYGCTPWSGENQLKLLKNLQTQKLEFPKTPVRSDKVKDLLREILQFDENKRPTWEQVFEHPLLNGQFELDKVGNQVANINGDSLSASNQEEAKYMLENKVAGYLYKQIEPNTQSTIQQQQQEQKQQEQQAKDKEQKKQGQENENDNSQKKNAQSNNNNTNSKTQGIDGSQDQQLSDIERRTSSQLNDGDVSKIIIDHIQDQKMRKNVLKVNEYILYERNISFFFNFVIQRMIRSYNQNIINIQPDEYFRVIYVVSKNQNIQLEKIRMLLTEKQQSFGQIDVWNRYKQSDGYYKTLQLILKDMNYSVKFFKDAQKKTEEVLQNLVQEANVNQQKLVLNKQFKIILNDNFTRDQAFNDCYQNTIREVLKKIVNNINKSQLLKDILILAQFLLVCQNPYNVFNNHNFDFGRFYEEIENMQAQDLYNSILGQFPK